MIYKVSIGFDMFISAEGEEDIHDIVAQDASDALEELLLSEPALDIEVVKDISEVPAQWRDAIPYGSYGDETIEQILEGENHER